MTKVECLTSLTFHTLFFQLIMCIIRVFKFFYLEFSVCEHTTLLTLFILQNVNSAKVRELGRTITVVVLHGNSLNMCKFKYFIFLANILEIGQLLLFLSHI